MKIKELEKNISDNKNEYLDYLLERFDKDKNKVIFYTILFKKILDPINGFNNFRFISEFPSQFYEFTKNDNNKIIIKFYRERIFEELENKIKNYFLNDLVFCDLKYFNNNNLKGFVEKEIIINLLENGKILNEKINNENIIKVDKINEIEFEKKLTNEIQINKPILIKQLNSNGEFFDLILIVNNKALFFKIIINKEKKEIDKIILCKS